MNNVYNINTIYVVLISRYHAHTKRLFIYFLKRKEINEITEQIKL